MEGAGLAREAVRERLDECFEAYARGLAAEIGDGRGVVTLPGIADLVRRLHDHEGVLLGLLTGNIEAGARIKLEPTGLLPYFRLGAYGSRITTTAGSFPRSPPAAPRAVGVRSRRPGGGHRRHAAGICARHFGAVAVAVATGQLSRGPGGRGPDLLFENFADVEDALARLLSSSPAS
jgi:phosphoglycolate phosphatase-like HAD superfamily hydrolase